MKNLKFLLLFFFSSILLLPSCKEDDFLPEGHPGTIRCKVNGVEWTPTRPDIWTPFQLQYYEDTKFFGLYAKRQLDDGSVNQSFSFDVSSTAIGENEINYTPQTFIDWKSSNPCGIYDLDTLRSHILEIESIDTQSRLILGRFFFTVYDKECNEYLEITDGEFNLSF